MTGPGPGWSAETDSTSNRSHRRTAQAARETVPEHPQGNLTRRFEASLNLSSQLIITYLSLPPFCRSRQVSRGLFALVSLFSGRTPSYSWMGMQAGRQQRLSGASGFCQHLDPQKNQHLCCLARESKSQAPKGGMEAGAGMPLRPHAPGRKLAGS